MSQNEIYLGNPNLKRANVAQNFTPEQVRIYKMSAGSSIFH